MAFTLSEIMAARRQQTQAQLQAQRGNRTAVEVDEYSTNPTQAFTFYNINQGRFQPPQVHMVDPMPHDSPKPPGYTRFVCISDYSLPHRQHPDAVRRRVHPRRRLHRAGTAL
ncbi:hypothetical protein KUCAC02_006486 [Chaenocephalus aceratus]|uniref:Uncharacterized protein n=1 Tax=Chaenocephalus aceratus TaxID=36190 RepID=A0ACB9VSL0_CHAAC|nr:hypothetical protein KUCAC02_006486 [Chaenocephalus aceratus]